MTDQLSGDFYARSFQGEEARDNTLILNLGPQHPSTHGVLRIIAEMDGEYALRLEPVLGYVHRNQEAMGENRNWHQFLPNMGRVDYLHALAWNWAYVGAVEKLAGIEISERAEYIRVITCELNRIKSHLLWWGAFLLDLGAFTPIMYGFDEIETMKDLLQIPTGSRLTYCYYRLGGVSADLTDEFLKGVSDYIPHLRARLPEFKNLVTDNFIMRERCEGVGVISPEVCRKYGATGPVLRGSGVAYDTRRAEPYSVYDRFEWQVPTRTEGDIMARYFVRMDEIEQSLAIIEQAIATIPEGEHIAKKAPKPLWKAPKGECYFAVEGARGKIGVYVVSNGDRIPYRIKLRAPGYCNLSLYAEVAEGTLLADALAILGSLDLVIPEIDR